MRGVELAWHVADALAGRGQNGDRRAGRAGCRARRAASSGRPGAASSDATASGRCSAPATWLTSRPVGLQRLARHEASGGVDWVVPGHPDLAAVVRIPVALLAFDGDTTTHNGDSYAVHEHVGHAGLQGWREKVADVVAPPTAKRTPVDEDTVRAIIGGAFFVLSVYYVIATIVKATRRARR